MLIGFDDLPPALKGYVSVLRQCVRGALEEFARGFGGQRAKLSARTEASIIHDLMVFNAKELRGQGLDWDLRKNLFLIKVGQDFRVKLKRLYGKWRPKSITTELVLDFQDQRPLRLFDDLDLTHLFLGYKRDEVELQNSTIWLVCPDGIGLKWVIELTSNDAVISMAVPNATAVEEPDSGRIRRRRAPDDDGARKKAEGE